MSLGSPAEIIPFTRFLKCRQRRNRLAVASDTVVTPASTELGIQPEVTQTRTTIAVASRRSVSAAVQPAMPHRDIAIL
jgi:hypothetical protein